LEFAKPSRFVDVEPIWNRELGIARQPSDSIPLAARGKHNLPAMSRARAPQSLGDPSLGDGSWTRIPFRPVAGFLAEEILCHRLF
jgi:hypothetical protein